MVSKRFIKETSKLFGPNGPKKEREIMLWNIIQIT